MAELIAKYSGKEQLKEFMEIQKQRLSVISLPWCPWSLNSMPYSLSR
jgi:hypothetical protein